MAPARRTATVTSRSATAFDRRVRVRLSGPERPRPGLKQQEPWRQRGLTRLRACASMRRAVGAVAGGALLSRFPMPRPHDRHTPA